ncbi:MAG: ABC transporter substrate-binding protein, partial [Deltaproteobacteria bacterium]|nr:ABC transporter substrate-binding protein [Deltaproteobacteria bacterium]
MAPAKLRLEFVALLVAIFVFANNGETRKVNVAIPTRGMPVIAFSAALERGYYREQGLDVQLILISAGVATRALIGGDVDFATVGGAGLPPVLSGAPLRFVFTTFNRPMFWLYARPDIREVKGLKGKRVGVSNIGSGPDSLLRETLKRSGMEGGRDVVVLALGLQGNIYAGLLSGAVDGAVIAPPFNFMAEEAGFRELVGFIKEDFVELQGAIVVREALLQSDPALVQKFIRGTLKGFRYARENRSGTVPILAGNLKIKQDLAARIYDAVRPGMTPDGTLSEELQKKALGHV